MVGSARLAVAVQVRMERNRRVLLGREVADTLTRATAALVEVLGSDPPRAEVWRVAANHTSTLLGVLACGAAELDRPLPPEAMAVADALRAWAVTARAASQPARVRAALPEPVVVQACPGRQTAPGPGRALRPWPWPREPRHLTES